MRCLAWPDRADPARPARFLAGLTLSAWIGLAGLAGVAGMAGVAGLVPATSRAAAPAAEPAAARLVGIAGVEGRPRMTAHLFTPLPDPAADALRHPSSGPASELRPAIVMLNAAPTAATGPNPTSGRATRISAQHLAWGRFWAEHGYLALLVDGSGARGPAQALDALAWLRQRPDVDPARIGLQGWSASGSTVLNLAFRTPPERGAAPGFRAAMAMYPGCGAGVWNRQSAKARIELLVLLAGRDDGNASCQTGLQDAQRIGGAVNIVLYEDAGHGFDEPAPRRLTTGSNRYAARDALARAEAFFARTLGP